MAQNDRAHDGFALTVRALGYLLRYPDAQWRGHLGDVWCALRESDSLSCVRLDQIAALVDSISAADELDAEAEYVDLFDRGRGSNTCMAIRASVGPR